MADLDLIKFLSNCQAYIILACCVLFFFFSQRLNQSIKFFCFYLFFLMIINFSASKMADLRINNLVVTHFLVLGEFIFLSAFFKEVLKENKFLHKYFKYYLGIIGGFILFNSLYFEAINTFNTNAKVLVLFVILFFATSFFYDRSTQLMKVDGNEIGLRILNSALLLYYSGSFFVYLFYKFTQNNKIFYSNKMMIFNAALYLIFTILVLIALLILIFYRKKSIPE